MPTFTLLPAEIKFRIWDEAIPKGRILSIHAPLPEEERARVSSTSLDLHLVNRLPPPALSQVDRASRAYVLRYYGIEPEHANIPWTVGMINFKWFHPENDILAFHNYGPGQDLRRFTIPWRGTEIPDMVLQHTSTASTPAGAYDPIGGKDAGAWFVSKKVRAGGVFDADTILIAFDTDTIGRFGALMNALWDKFPKLHKVVLAKVPSLQNNLRVLGTTPCVGPLAKDDYRARLWLLLLNAQGVTTSSLEYRFAALTSTCRPSSRDLIASVARQFARYKGGMAHNCDRVEAIRLLLGYTLPPELIPPMMSSPDDDRDNEAAPSGQ